MKNDQTPRAESFERNDISSDAVDDSAIIAHVNELLDQCDDFGAATIISVLPTTAISIGNLANLHLSARVPHSNDAVAFHVRKLSRSEQFNTFEKSQLLMIAAGTKDQVLSEEIESLFTDAERLSKDYVLAKLRQPQKDGGKDRFAFVEPFVDRRRKELDVVYKMLRWCAEELDAADAQRVFDHAWGAIATPCETAEHHRLDIVLLAKDNGWLQDDAAAAQVSTIGHEASGERLVRALILLADVDEDHFNSLWGQRKRNLFSTITAEYFLLLSQAAGRRLDSEAWAELIRFIAQKRLFDSAESMVDFLKAVGQRRQYHDDIAQIIDVLLKATRESIRNRSVFAYFNRMAPSWNLWKAHDALALVAAEAGALPRLDKALFTSLWLSVCGEKAAAYDELHENNIAWPQSLEPLVREVSLSTRVHSLSDILTRYDPDSFNALSVVPELPPDGERVLVICERGADPSAFLSLKEKGYAITLCIMDSWESPHEEAPKEFWSLRDLFLDSDELSKRVKYSLREVSKSVVGHYLNAKSRVQETEKDSGYERTLSVALEDSLESPLTMACCMLRAIGRFKGDHVVLALTGGAGFFPFADAFLECDKKLYFVLTAENAHTAVQKLRRLNEQEVLADAVSSKRLLGRSDFDIDVSGLESYFARIPKPRRPAVLVMSSFTDPLYRETMLPVIDRLLLEKDVYVFEPSSLSAAREALAPSLRMSVERQEQDAGQLVLIPGGEAIDSVLQASPNDDEFWRAVTSTALRTLKLSNFDFAGLDVTDFLYESLPATLKRTIRRLEVVSAVFDALIEKFRFDAFFVCSERLPVRMVAVESAQKHGLHAIDVMALNAVRFPRYRPPKSDTLTSIDTITSDFFKNFYGTPSENIALTGSPRMDHILSLIRDVDESAVRAALDVAGDAKIILYACQLQPIEWCISILQQLIKVVDQNPDAVLIVKLHRRENFAREKIYEEALKGSANIDRIIMVRDHPILDDMTKCLSVADVVVSIYSNALREAACVNAPFVAADYFEAPVPFDYFEGGIGLKATSEDDLFEKVDKLVKWGPDTLYKKRAAQFFECNSQLTDGNSAVRIAQLANGSYRDA